MKFISSVRSPLGMNLVAERQDGLSYPGSPARTTDSSVAPASARLFSLG
jgi:hypothetical protein